MGPALFERCRLFSRDRLSSAAEVARWRLIVLQERDCLRGLWVKRQLEASRDSGPEQAVAHK